MVLIKCSKCGKLMKRAIKRKDAVCFDCKTKRNRIQSKKTMRKLRAKK